MENELKKNKRFFNLFKLRKYRVAILGTWKMFGQFWRFKKSMKIAVVFSTNIYFYFKEISKYLDYKRERRSRVKKIEEKPRKKTGRTMSTKTKRIS